MRTALTFAALSGLMLAVAACDTREPATADPSQAGDAPPAPGQPPVSILRPEVEQPEEAPIAMRPIERTISFAQGGSDLSDAAVRRLETLLVTEQMQGDGAIVIGGHSDAGGNDAANERASLARAEAVRDWLVEKGIDAARITVIAFGEQNPVEPNALPDGSPNEEGRAANRRVEISVEPPATTSANDAVAEEPAE